VREVLPGVFAIPQNGGNGFGYCHFARASGGNIVPCAGSISEHFGAIEALGGVAAVVISDRHLGGEATNRIAEHFNAPVYCSAIEAEAMAHRKQPVRIDYVMPYERATIVGGALLVPTPGHTPGQFSTLAEVEGARILFTADFVWREGGKWRPGNLSRKKIAKSFEALRDLAFDFVVPWTGYSHDEFFVAVPDVDAAVDAMIAGCTKP
jgi:hypothetical protein